jgi:hypothetical protein
MSKYRRCTEGRRVSTGLRLSNSSGTAFFDPVKETRKVRPGVDKERREVVGFQASRGVLLGFEVEMARLCRSENSAAVSRQ